MTKGEQTEAEDAVKDLESWAKRFTEIGIYGLSMTHEEVNDLAISIGLLLAERRGLREALRDAEVGLQFAGADIEIAEGDFVPTPTLALRNVRTALQGKGGGGE